MAWDRYAYTSNNPVNYTDPSGHCNMYMVEIGECTADELTTATTVTETPDEEPSTTNTYLPEEDLEEPQSPILYVLSIILPFDLFAAGRDGGPPSLRILGAGYVGTSYDVISVNGKVLAGAVDIDGTLLGGSTFATQEQLAQTLSRGNIYTIPAGTELGNLSPVEIKPGYYRLVTISDIDALQLGKEYQSLWTNTGNKFKNGNVIGGGGGGGLAGPLDMFVVR